MTDVSHILSQVLQKIKLMDDKYEKISKVLVDKIVNSKYVEAEFEEVDCSNQNKYIFYQRYF